MTKQGKTVRPRRASTTEDSVLIRSAESLGRMIGSLQRQLDGASAKLPAVGAFARQVISANGNMAQPRKKTSASTAAPPKASTAKARAKQPSGQAKRPSGAAKQSSGSMKPTAAVRAAKRASASPRARKAAPASGRPKRTAKKTASRTR